MLMNEMSDPVRDDAGLSATGPRQYEQRSMKMANRLLLLGIESLEKIHESPGSCDFNTDWTLGLRAALSRVAAK